MSTVQLHLLNEVQCKFVGLTPKVRSLLIKAVTYKDQTAKWTPAGRLGQWAGTISFMNMGGKTYIHLLDILLPILEAEGIAVDVIDERKIPQDIVFDPIDENYLADIEFPIGHHMEGEKIILRDHQVTLVNELLANRHATIESATGSGKSLICVALSKKIQEHGRTIVIVPSKDLVTQTEEDYKLCGLDVGVMYGGRKEYNKTHTICTWQSLNCLWKKSKKKARGEVEMTEAEISEFIEGVECVIVDEAHGASAEATRGLLGIAMCDVRLRYGMTGTIPKDEIKAVQIKCNVGPVVSGIGAADLQQKGILSSCNVNIIQTSSKLKFADYQEELTCLVTDQKRISYIAQLISAIAESGNTLVLVGRVETGHILIDELQLPKQNFVHGGTPKAKREGMYKSIADVDNEILVCTSGVASTGLNIPRLFNVVLIEPGKAFTTIIQSIGRGLRVAKDKDHVDIYDFCSTTKYSARHMRERKKYYADAKYPFEHTKITDWDE